MRALVEELILRIGVVILGRSSVVIGRSRGVVHPRFEGARLLTLNWPDVSRKHCTLTRANSSDEVIVEDLTSTNGTWIYTETGELSRVAGSVHVRLPCRLKLGDSLITVFSYAGLLRHSLKLLRRLLDVRVQKGCARPVAPAGSPGSKPMEPVQDGLDELMKENEAPSALSSPTKQPRRKRRESFGKGHCLTLARALINFSDDGLDEERVASDIASISRELGRNDYFWTGDLRILEAFGLVSAEATIAPPGYHTLSDRFSLVIFRRKQPERVFNS